MVAFSLYELIKEVSNNQILSELKTIIDNEKFIIIDNIVKKTCIAIRGSLKYGKKFIKKLFFKESSLIAGGGN